MYSYLFIYIYVLEVYTLTWVLSLIYLTCYGSMYTYSTGIPVTSTVSFPVPPCCSRPEMLYVKVFLY